MRLGTVIAGCVAMTALAVSLFAPSASAAVPKWFSPTSFWNRPLGAAHNVDSRSAGYVSELVRQVESAGPWINTDKYSVPVYVVGPDQPQVAVRLSPPGEGWAEPALQAALSAVPIPPEAEPAAGTDKHMVVYQPATDEMWEFWDLRREGGEWVTGYGGAMREVSADPGYYNPAAWPGAGTDWGATASSLPLLGGLMTISELEAGRIEHALAMAIPEPSPSHVWPAQRSDGFNEAPNAIPEGTIFRLPASLDLAALNLPPITLEIARAAQRYGMVVRDVAGCVCLYGEDPTPTGTNPYGRLFEGKWPDEVLARFPWDKLQAVTTDLIEASGAALRGTFSPWP